MGHSQPLYPYQSLFTLVVRITLPMTVSTYKSLHLNLMSNISTFDDAFEVPISGFPKFKRCLMNKREAHNDDDDDDDDDVSTATVR